MNILSEFKMIYYLIDIFTAKMYTIIELCSFEFIKINIPHCFKCVHIVHFVYFILLQYYICLNLLFIVVHFQYIIITVYNT